MAAEAGLPSKTLSVPHLGGTRVGYHLPKSIVGSKPTVVLIPPFLTTVTFFRPQFTDPALTEGANLISLEPLGHGNTTTGSPCFTAWDSAIAFWQVLDSLNVKKAILLGSSQAGWIAARMALLQPDRVLGLVAVSTTFSANGSHITDAGSLDFAGELEKVIANFTTPDEKFVLPEALAKTAAELSLGPNANENDVKLVFFSPSKFYPGEAGRKKFREASIALITRDSLQLRLPSLKIPILWLQGGEDKIFVEAVPKADIEHLKNATVKFEVIPGAYHALTWSHAQQVNPILGEFIKKYGGKADARALREAVGMVDI